MLLHSSPWKRPEILLVMKFDCLAAAPHELVGYLFVGDGEIEYVGLNRGGTSCLGNAALESGLDQPALVGLPYIAFVGELVKFSGFHAIPEHEIEPEIDECRRGQDAGG